MNIINSQISHKKYGVGVVKEQDSKYVYVKFENIDGVKKFAFPSAFENFITTSDTKVFQEVREKLDKINAIKNEKAMKKKAAEALLQEQQNKTKSKNSVAMHNDGHVAIKFNMCDGGRSNEKVGFCGVCSKENIEHNVNKAKFVRCAAEDSDCRKYLEGEFTYEELGMIYESDGKLCNESQMLTTWQAYSGLYQSGAHAGEPVRFTEVRKGGLAMLTTMVPKSKEKERFIFAVFLIDQFKDGTRKVPDSIIADPKYRIALSLEEAKQVKFWDYYHNNKTPENARFGSGLHRYFNNDQAAQVLIKIAELKKGTEDEALMNEFVAHFCEINTLELENIAKPNGALTR